MKKIIYLMCIVLFVVGCRDVNKQSDNAFHITVTTSFLKDMVDQLNLENVQVEIIIPVGEDPHTYEPKPEDYQKIAHADLVFYHGLHFEGKMTEMLQANQAYSVTNTFTQQDLLVMNEDGQEIIDPHFWFDIDLYQKAFHHLADHVSEVLPAQVSRIEKAVQVYDQKLDELIEYTKKEIATIPEQSRYLISPHDAFQYFSRYYHILAIAPQGVSTDSEVSNQELLQTAQFIVDHQVKAIFTETTTDPVRMEKLQESVKAKGFTVQVVGEQQDALYSDSLGIIGSDAQTFVGMVKHNVDTIVKYLR